MNLDTRRTREDETRVYQETASIASLKRPDPNKIVEEIRGSWDLELVWVTADGERIAGVFRSPTFLG